MLFGFGVVEGERSRAVEGLGHGSVRGLRLLGLRVWECPRIRDCFGFKVQGLGCLSFRGLRLFRALSL